jgi:GTPase SAR1 family protein
MRKPTPAVCLAERMCRPQRIGVFGHRGVGKTTLLTMLYREAVGGRLPDLRLAAADARTADYLSDKVLQLEAGRPLPATLGETELRFHLYYRDTRLDLLFKDYQGEHVAVGRQEPIRDFLRDCDAVWLCLDVPAAAAAEHRLRAQQEVEQLIEDYLAAEPQGNLHRPMALVLTKADLLRGTDTAPEELMERQFAMTRHALRLHCPQHALFAVSSLGASLPAAVEGQPPPPFAPQPSGLDGPLAWLAAVLQDQDEARLKRLWQEAGTNLPLLGKCVTSFARRYPGAPAAQKQREELAERRRRRRNRRWLFGAAAAACLVLGIGTYDAVGEQAAARFAAEHADDPASVRERWLRYRAWHPTRHFLRPAAAEAERERLRTLDEQVRTKQRDERLADLRRRAADPDADPESVWQELQAFHADYPEQDVGDDWQQFRASLKARRDQERERRAQAAFADLERLEPQGNLPLLVEHADRFLRDHAGTSPESEVRRCRAAYLLRLDERDVDEARAYSAANPLNFQTRREHYQHYLERHPEGAFAGEAREALAAIDADWDKHDFRQVRDHFQEHPGDIKELEKLCRSYLAVHPQGRFRASARDVLRWTERVTQPGEYRVVLKSGSFDPKIAAWFSRGPSLSVALEVNGVRYGPSNIVSRNYNPEWNYEFPRRIRWKLGDTVRIFVTDHYYWTRPLLHLGNEDSDVLGMRLLSGAVEVGANRLTFESDFTMPAMPKIE